MMDYFGNGSCGCFLPSWHCLHESSIEDFKDFFVIYGVGAYLLQDMMMKQNEHISNILMDDANMNRCETAKVDYRKNFFPYATEKLNELYSSNKLLAYYTTTDTAKSILENKEIWMRNATVMNDYQEVWYGIEKINCLLGYSGERNSSLAQLGEMLRDSLKDINTTSGINIFEEVKELFHEEQCSFALNTYIACFTEHEEKENKLGRLSMWRAYGGDNGVAIVFHPKPGCDIDESRITLTPVAYLDDDAFYGEVYRIVKNIDENKVILCHSPYEDLKNNLMQMLRYAIVAIKHPGFQEEREWRIVAHGQDLRCETEVIKGVVQPVKKYKISHINAMLHHIIIGPTLYYNVIYKGFERILKSKYQMEDVASRLVCSYIPYRSV